MVSIDGSMLIVIGGHANWTLFPFFFFFNRITNLDQGKDFRMSLTKCLRTSLCIRLREVS